ncbi:MAG: NIPSNAP family protein, partial [Phycisphaerales bacterium]
GSQMPNLTYMLVFDDLTHRDAMWDVFRVDPEWKKISSDPQYKDTVSNITDIILRPTGYSQI